MIASGSARDRGAVPRRAAGTVRVIIPGAVAFLLAPGTARACQACFGAGDAPIIDGARAGAWVLIALTLTVQGAFAGFFFYLRRRAGKAAASMPGPEAPGPHS